MLQSSVSAGYLLPCPLCDAPLEPRLFRQHLDRHYPRDSPVCPVLQCGRRFAHPNSVRNHMRIKHTMQWAKMKAMRSSGGPFSGASDFKWSLHWKCIFLCLIYYSIRNIVFSFRCFVFFVWFILLLEIDLSFIALHYSFVIYFNCYQMNEQENETTRKTILVRKLISLYFIF